MASTRLQVLRGVKDLIQGVLPYAEVLGLDADDAKPERIAPGGTIIIRSGDPGQPDVDLSPLTYNYQHAIPLEIGAYESAGRESEDVLDELLGAIGAAVKANPTLGGLCQFMEAQAPVTEDFDTPGAVAGRWADAQIIAWYATSDPLN